MNSVHIANSTLQHEDTQDGLELDLLNTLFGKLTNISAFEEKRFYFCYALYKTGYYQANKMPKHLP